MQFTMRAYGSGLTLFFFQPSAKIKSHEGHYRLYSSFYFKLCFYFIFFTQGQVPNVYTRWQCRLNLTSTFKKKRCFRRRCRFLQKSASLFRGTFCFMRLTDIPLCIWLCLFRVSHWFKQKDTHWYHQQMHCVQRNRRMKRRLLYTIYFLFSFFLVTKGSNHCFILLFYKWFIVLWYNKKRESWR